jgi:hypothetical protein
MRKDKVGSRVELQPRQTHVVANIAIGPARVGLHAHFSGL